MDFDRHGFDREVGLRLQLMRKRRGATQAVLAEKIGLPRASYANIEAGRQRVPVDIVWRASVVLGVPISSLVPEPVNKPTAVESLLPAAEFGGPGVTVTTSGSGGVGGDTWMTMAYVGGTLYPMIPHHAAPLDTAVAQKRPTVRIVRGSKSERETS